MGSLYRLIGSVFVLLRGGGHCKNLDGGSSGLFCEFAEMAQRLQYQARVDGLRAALDTLLEIQGDARYDKSGGSIEKDDVAPRR